GGSATGHSRGARPAARRPTAAARGKGGGRRGPGDHKPGPPAGGRGPGDPKAPSPRRILGVNRQACPPVFEHRPMARLLRIACFIAAPVAAWATLGVPPAAAQFFNPFEALFGPPPRPPSSVPSGPPQQGYPRYPDQRYRGHHPPHPAFTPPTVLGRESGPGTPLPGGAPAPPWGGGANPTLPPPRGAPRGGRPPPRPAPARGPPPAPPIPRRSRAMRSSPS